MVDKGNGDLVERQERFCSLCLMNNIMVTGDEQHAFMECPYFEKERKSLVQSIECICPKFKSLCNYDKFRYILLQENERLLCLVSKFSHVILSVPRKIKPAQRKKKHIKNKHLKLL